MTLVESGIVLIMLALATVAILSQTSGYSR